jgi:hypothetical protein
MSMAALTPVSDSVIAAVELLSGAVVEARGSSVPVTGSIAGTPVTGLPSPLSVIVYCTFQTVPLSWNGGLPAASRVRIFGSEGVTIL